MISKALNTHVRISLNQPDKFAPLQSGGQSWLTQNPLSPRPLNSSLVQYLVDCILANQQSVVFPQIQSKFLRNMHKTSHQQVKVGNVAEDPSHPDSNKSRKSLTKSVPKSAKIIWTFVPRHMTNSPTAEKHKGSVSSERRTSAQLPSDVFLPFSF